MMENIENSYITQFEYPTLFITLEVQMYVYCYRGSLVLNRKLLDSY